jgi:hypothetical protein
MTFQSPWAQPSYGKKKAAKKKAKKKAKKAKPKAKKKAKKKTKPKPAQRRAPARPTMRRLKTAGSASCNRSPCGAYDPKLSLEEIAAARELVAKSPGKKLRRRVVMDKQGVPQGKYFKESGRRGRSWKPKYAKTSDPHRPLPARPFAVAYGLGLDSTAILVGLVQEYRRARTAKERRKWRPDVITFADVGSEKKLSYDFLRTMNAYLVKNGFPRITVVAWRTEFTAKGWGSAQTLEQQVLLNQSGPSITEYFGSQSKCSSLWKQQPQNDWMRHSSGLWERVKKKGARGYEWRPIGGLIVKAIGYDATEERRMAPDGGGSGATFRIKMTKGEGSARGDGYRYWYPLVEWGWDRARCRAEVEREMGVAPPKSSCTFCFAMKPEEVVSLSKDEQKRAAFMELVRRHGRQAFRLQWKIKNGLASKDPKKGVKGLAGSWSWTELFVKGALGMRKTDPGWSYSEERSAKIDALVLERTGGRTCLTRGEVARLDRQAQQFVARTADKGRSVQVDTISKARILKALGMVPKLGKDPDLAGWRKVYKWAVGKRAPAKETAKELSKAVFAAMKSVSSRNPLSDTHFKGQFDMADDRWLQRLAAWKDLKGFRGGRQMTWARNPDPGEVSGYTTHTLQIPTDLYGIAWPVL